MSENQKILLEGFLENVSVHTEAQNPSTKSIIATTELLPCTGEGLRRMFPGCEPSGAYSALPRPNTGPWETAEETFHTKTNIDNGSRSCFIATTPTGTHLCKPPQVSSVYAAVMICTLLILPVGPLGQTGGF